MTGARHVYIGPDTPEWGIEQMTPVRVRAHPKGTSRMVRDFRALIETEIGDQFSVPRKYVIERARFQVLFPDATPDETREDEKARKLADGLLLGALRA